MGYATRQDIEDIYGASWLETLVPHDVDIDTAVQRALDLASALVDGYLLTRYTLPLPFVPDLLVNFTIDIACWKLAPASERLTDEIKDRAKAAIAQLKDISAGNMEVPGLEDASAGNGSGGELPADGQTGASCDGAAYFSEERRFPRGGGLP